MAHPVLEQDEVVPRRGAARVDVHHPLVRLHRLVEAAREVRLIGRRELRIERRSTGQRRDGEQAADVSEEAAPVWSEAPETPADSSSSRCNCSTPE